MVELLSPVGDFECLKAAVQNGADTVYFGASSFSARAFASNFNDDDLKKAITYAKIRGIKTNLTLNTLLKDNEFNDAIKLAEKAYFELADIYNFKTIECCINDEIRTIDDINDELFNYVIDYIKKETNN